MSALVADYLRELSNDRAEFDRLERLQDQVIEQIESFSASDRIEPRRCTTNCPTPALAAGNFIGDVNEAANVRTPQVAAVVPCYRPGRTVLDVIGSMPDVVDVILVVDDACPDDTGAMVESETKDPRVRVLRCEENRGVGGATIAGYREAMKLGCDVAVKIDSDGRMNPRMIPALVAPILAGRADYVKGNRFFDFDRVAQMPAVRKVGNAGLSFLTKMSSGYWCTMDPTNGFTAIHVRILSLLPLDRIASRYFFDSDMLFRLGTLQAVVLDAPMSARYGGEESHLMPRRVIVEFAARNLVNTYKRLIYNHFIRGFSIASLELVLGCAMVVFGILVRANAWIDGLRANVPATPGTVMLAGLPIFLGAQFVLGFLHADMAARADEPVHLRVSDLDRFDA